eukprot:TRINITY_DN2648_c0_g4_i1.p1 TRINITY_DN2648_c0_g4~~TRINITY_DN2648_c0_g4_i1.p1  ORF type:complete len:236 (+),score=-30.21 TRINITY_DN2648_c0_g4_i1:678-1385(+)
MNSESCLQRKTYNLYRNISTFKKKIIKQRNQESQNTKPSLKTQSCNRKNIKKFLNKKTKIVSRQQQIINLLSYQINTYFHLSYNKLLYYNCNNIIMQQQSRLYDNLLVQLLNFTQKIYKVYVVTYYSPSKLYIIAILHKVQKKFFLYVFPQVTITKIIKITTITLYIIVQNLINSKNATNFQRYYLLLLVIYETTTLKKHNRLKFLFLYFLDDYWKVFTKIADIQFSQYAYMHYV